MTTTTGASESGDNGDALLAAKWARDDRRDEALARLREVVKPGVQVRVISRGFTRSGYEQVAVYADSGLLPAPVDIGRDVAAALDLHMVPKTDHLSLHPEFGPWLPALADRLSVALFGEPGQIKGEYP